ncbi:F-box/LRR-repeat protein 13-like [Panicum miliaceum]|uniref:F-box/LRR-repeat protein 13-like n=1 Tax=Panicum miliaceum TaxID=4540 RepID=A0A3L6QJM0_PANMI|nr:F-box/LRR-repeat protein 13-like [Panicum miliaceum]
MAPPALKDGIPGTGQLLQYPASFVGSGYILTRTEKKTEHCYKLFWYSVLALKVKLGTRIEARMLPSFLRCFPNVETLYIQFWKEARSTECVQRHIKKVVLREFRGTRSELDFLRFIAEQAQVLEKMVIVLTHGHSPSGPVGTNLRAKMSSAKWANARCELMICQTPFHQEGTAWCYLAAFDLSNPDPFHVSKCLDGKCRSH